MKSFLLTHVSLCRKAVKAIPPLVIFLLWAGAAYAQVRTATGQQTASVTVTGNVKDAAGEPLPGANVIIKGAKVGTVTNGEGNFKISLPTGNEALIISSVGYKAREVQVNGQTTLNITLDDDVASISEVVVVGYGTQKKVSLTGAVAAVDMKAIQELPVGSLSAALQGQMPGVSVSGGTSRPGDNAQITV